jgi:hypothetical protein
MTTQNGQCASEFCSKRFAASVLVGGPLSFVFDFVSADSGFDSLRYIFDAASVPTLKRGMGEAQFEALYSLPRTLRFEAASARDAVTSNDWWREVY